VRRLIAAGRRGAVRASLGVGTPTSRELTLPSRTDVAIVVAAATAGSFALALPGALAGAVGAIIVRRWQARRAGRVPAIVAQERFADALGSIAAAVRAGASLPQALSYAAGEAEPPIREGLDQLVGDLEVGLPIERALEHLRATSPSPDTDLVVGALELHRRSGGDLPAVLEQVTSTIRGRVSVAREVRSLTAQARLSAWILGLLPVGFFAFLMVAARSDVQGALGTPIGVLCIVVGLLLEGGAVLWIRSLIRVG
jgi:tight adherence protein B